MLFPHTNFINYNNYSGYRMPTTIQIDHETKERLKSFGSKGETYQDIIKRLYDIVDGFKLKCFDSKELTDLLLQFVRMSDKKDQQKVIGEIKHILRLIGTSGFE